MKLRNKLADMGVCALCALLISISVSMTMLTSLSIPYALTSVLLLCGGMVVFLALTRINRWSALICLGLLGGALTMLVLRENSPLRLLPNALRSLVRLLISGEGSLLDHAALIIALVTLCSAFISFCLSRMSGGVYPALLLFLCVILGCWLLQETLSVWMVFPGLVALGLLYARSYKSGPASLQAISLTLAAALIAVLLVPSGRVTWAPLKEAADKVQQMFYDYFLFTDPRAVYSVARDGFQPLGETLGGPAQPHEEQIMQVKTDENLLLRGSIKRTYTGNSWIDASINSRYLFRDPTRQNKLVRIFGSDKAEAFSEYAHLDEVSVELLSEGTSTLFVSNRLKSLGIALDQAAYFNDSGEVFIARSVEPGDHYDFTAWQLDASLPELADLFLAAAQAGDSDYAAICSEYMNLPKSLEDGVYWITLSIVEGLSTPLEKALAIQQYLADHYTYSIDVPYPPANRDFVSHFLLSETSGYCTYFASAMAVMARMADLPSRYVEGYLVVAEEDGTTTVTGAEAHAWVEIYFEGVGWVSFDPTPGSPENPANPGDSSDSFEPPVTPEPTPTPTPDPNVPAPDVTPTPEPPQEDPLVEDTPEPEPSDDDSFVEPTPTPDVTPPQPPQDDADRQSHALLWTMLALIALLLALCALLYKRLKDTHPAALAAREKDDALRLLIWYRAILTLLAAQGFDPQGGESPMVFADRLATGGDAPEAFLSLARAVALSSYSGRKPDAQVYAQADLAYHTLLSQMKKTTLIRYLMRRVLHGIGNYRQIP